MADSLATLAMQEYVGKGNAKLIPTSDSKRVWYAYTQATGGRKNVMRITGKLRQMLKYHIQNFLTLRHISGNISGVTHQRKKTTSIK